MNKLTNLCLIPLLILGGCSVKSGVIPPISQSQTTDKTVAYGTVQLAIKWPQKLITQGIPDSAQFIRIRIFRNGTLMKMPDPDNLSSSIDLDEIHPRQAANTRVNIKYRLPIGGGYLVEVRAYKDCPYDVATQVLNEHIADGTPLPRRNLALKTNARIVAEGLGMDQVVRLPNFDAQGSQDSNQSANTLTITLDQTVLVAGIGGSAGSNTPEGVDPGIDLGNGGNGGYPNYIQDARFRELDEPSGVFFDKETKDVYFCDKDTIMAVRGDGSFFIPKFQGTQTGIGDGGPATDAQLSTPASLMSPGNGSVYLWDTGNTSLRSVTNGVITNYLTYNKGALHAAEIAQGQTAAFGQINFTGIRDLSFAPDGSGHQYLYALDGNILMRSIDKGNWSIAAGTVNYKDAAGAAHQTKYPATPIDFNDATRICTRQSDVLIMDQGQTSGQIIQIGHDNATSSHPLPEDSKLKPQAICQGADANTVYLACANYIVRYHLDTNTVDKLTGIDKPAPSAGMTAGTATNYTVTNPAGIAYYGGKVYFIQGLAIYAIDVNTNQISHCAGYGSAGYVRDNMTATKAPLGQPTHLSADADGLYISDSSVSTIFKVHNGIIYRFAGGSLASGGTIVQPSSITYSKARNKIYATDVGKQAASEDAVWEIDPTTFVTKKVAGNPAGIADSDLFVNNPRGVAADSYGNVYFANTSDNTIRQVAFGDPNPIIIAGTRTGGLNLTNIDARLVQLKEPTSVRVYEKSDQSEISLFFLDKGNQRICKLVPYTTPATPSWNISVVAGGGSQAITNGAIAARSTLNGATDLDVDKYGNIYVAEGNKIWIIDRAGYASLLYPRTGEGVGNFDSIAVYISDDGVREIYFTVPGSQQLRKLYP